MRKMPKSRDKGIKNDFGGEVYKAGKPNRIKRKSSGNKMAVAVKKAGGEEEKNGAGLSLVKGTREYAPTEQLVREGIVDVLKSNFKKYGYGPIETSILEHYEIAANKYGGGAEILKETYRLSDQGGRELVLRPELTFKLAKMIGMNPTMRLPFKRYEIGKVFRDGPVKTGRLREFTQCDADAVGVENLAVDAEFIRMTQDIFSGLKLDIFVQVNNRKLIFGLAETAGIGADKYTDVALSLDKLEKFGEDTVRKELVEKGIAQDSIGTLFEMLKGAGAKKTNGEKIAYFESALTEGLGKQGVGELRELFSYCADLDTKLDLRFVPTLARGLGYYTGPMWEVYLQESKSITGTVAAGGRWDEMIGKFLGGAQRYPATGMTFGLDVIYAALEEKEFAGFGSTSQTKVPTILLIPINTLDRTLRVANELREAGVSVDVAYGKKLSKALDYADKQEIPYVAIIGEKGLREGKLSVRNMVTGKEEDLQVDSAPKRFKAILRESEEAKSAT